jgi:hypothetical protein
MKKKQFYVVTMYRWGDRQAHAYCIGVFSNPDIADRAGNTEKAWRGNKYEPVIEPFVLDDYGNIEENEEEYYKNFLANIESSTLYD